MKELSLENKLVLVTGGSGFVATHIIQRLLKEKAKVRTTVRDIKNKSKVDPVENLVLDNNKDLEIVEAELTDSKCWNKVVEGCDYVVHVASPVFATSENPKNEIDQAIKGTTNVLNACVKYNIKKVVVTSSIAATSRCD